MPLCSLHISGGTGTGIGNDEGTSPLPAGTGTEIEINVVKEVVPSTCTNMNTDAVGVGIGKVLSPAAYQQANRPLPAMSDDTDDEGSQSDIFEAIGATQVDEEGSDRDSSSESASGKTMDGGRGGRGRGAKEMEMGRIRSSASDLTLSVAAYAYTSTSSREQIGCALSFSEDTVDSSINWVDSPTHVPAVFSSVFADESCSASGSASRSRSGSESDYGGSEEDEEEAMRTTKALLTLVILEGAKVKADSGVIRKKKRQRGSRKISLVPEGDENEDEA